jgi:hypothetical protein
MFDFKYITRIEGGRKDGFIHGNRGHSGFSGRRSDFRSFLVFLVIPVFRSFRRFDRSSCLPIVPGSVVDPDQDPYEFRPPGSRSVIIICTNPDPSIIKQKK